MRFQNWNLASASGSGTAALPRIFWDLTAYEHQGNLWLKWSTNSPFRAQQGQISVYSGSNWPSNPQDQRKAWTWDDQKNNPWDTGQRWGSDWYCAYIAEASPNGPYRYFIKLITAGASKPELKTAE